MSDYPAQPVPVNHVEPVPRRIRAFLAGRAVFDTTDARYVWENTSYPQYYIPLADIDANVLVDEGTAMETSRGDARRYGLRVGDVDRPSAATVLTAAKVEGLDDTVRFAWSAFDAWFEEDEQVFVHPRNPYTRVDSLRSSRHLRVESKGVVLAETSSPVLCFETGLADPLLHRSDRRRLHPLGAVRHRDRVSLQGNHERLLVGGGRSADPSGHRVDLRLSRPVSFCPSQG